MGDCLLPSRVSLGRGYLLSAIESVPCLQKESNHSETRLVRLRRRGNGDGISPNGFESAPLIDGNSVSANGGREQGKMNFQSVE